VLLKPRALVSLGVDFLLFAENSVFMLLIGLLALSIERNSSMKMWNLTKGRCSFTTKLPQQAELVNFFPQAGESYALALENVMEIRNAETGSTIHRLQHDKRIFCMAQRQVHKILHFGGLYSFIITFVLFF